MAHFRGTLQGMRGETSRLGSKSSGLTADCDGWQGGVRVSLYVNDAGEDSAQVELTDGSGSDGLAVTVYQGPIGSNTREALRAAKRADVDRMNAALEARMLADLAR